MRIKGIKYNMSGNWDDVCDLLRRYKTDDVLKRINKESTSLLMKKNNDMPGVKRAFITTVHTNNGMIEKKNTFVMSWSLVDLAYLMIIASNDYRGKSIEKDEELYLLQNASDGYLEKIESEYLKNRNNNSELLIHMFGFAGEQLKFERPEMVFTNIQRDLYILLELNTNTSFDISSIVKKEIGVTWEKAEAFLRIAWIGFEEMDTLKEIESKDIWKSEKDKTDFKNVISRYTIDYDGIRKSKLQRQILYTRPFIKTQRGEVVSVSAYLNLFLSEHCVLWLIRDYFRKIDDKKFINYFGKLFEKYFEELLSECIKESEYERICESHKGKRADWRLKIDGFNFLIEQKSTILRLGAKQQMTDIFDLKDFGEKTIMKAVKQLKETEDYYGDGKYIKVILLYEDYLNSESLENYMNISSIEIENDCYYWIMTIGEMEKLLMLCSKDRKKFDEIVSEKIKRENNHSKQGKSIEFLLNEIGVFQNTYIDQNKFSKYEDIIQKEVNKILKK